MGQHHETEYERQLLKEYLKNLWRWSVGKSELVKKRMPDIASLAKSEWSPKFEMYMRNRLIMGAIRYGLLNAPGKPTYDRIGRAIAELKLFQEDHNGERLVDVANMMLLEFEEGKPNFEALEGGLHNEPL